MCYGCYEEAGKPRVVTPETAKAAGLISMLNEFGPLHIIVSDWNLEDDNIAFCSGEEQTERYWSGPMSDNDRALLRLLRTMTLEERVSAMALANGYLMPNGDYAGPGAE